MNCNRFAHKLIVIFKVSFVIFLIFWSGYSSGQKNYSPSKSMEAELHTAEVNLKSLKNNKALVIVKRLLTDLSEQDQLNSYFGLRTRLAEATVYQQKDQDSLAITLLHGILEKCKQKETTDIYIKACLLMALLHEKVDSKGNSLKYLIYAKTSIDNYKIDSLYPHYAIRMASWKRFYESYESAIPYAQQVLELSPKHGLKLEEAVGHMLMTSLLFRINPDSSFKHSLKAIQLYKNINDHVGQSFMYNNTAKAYLSRSDFHNALLYNDSSLAILSKNILDGYDLNRVFGPAYLLKGSIYEGLGKLDSAWYYLNLGHKMEIEALKSKIINKVNEMEMINNSTKIQREYQEELKQRSQLIAGVVLVSILMLVWTYSIFRNNKKQKKTSFFLEETNKLIIDQAEQLKRLDIAKSVFFANASHELRTPLTLILSPVETMLRDETLSEQQERLLMFIHQGSKDLSSLISRILDLGKLDAGTMEVYLNPTNAFTFFQTVFSQFESLADSRKISYTYLIDLPDKLCILLDKEKCRQIIYNLLSNAFKFTLAGGSVSAKVYLNGQDLNIEVIDTGNGIEEQDLPYLFNRYFQTNKTGKVAQGGMGIGLGICKEYLNLLGGLITVKSKIGEGSTFHVHFPIKYANELVQEELYIVNPRNSKQLENKSLMAETPTILVVEDNVQLREYINLVLQSDYNVVLAEHGEEALAKIRSNVDIALVISDLMMPIMDGYQLLNTLKQEENTARIPVIMLTARAEKDVKLKALRIGVDDYMTKPFNEEELNVRIANLLRNYKVRNETILESDQESSLLSESDKEWLVKFDLYIHKIYLAKNFSISDIAFEFAMSESTLLRKLKKLTGFSPQQYIQEVRLQSAYILINENRNNHTIKQISLLTGYKDIRSFSRAFKTRFGRLPSEINSL